MARNRNYTVQGSSVAILEWSVIRKLELRMNSILLESEREVRWWNEVGRCV